MSSVALSSAIERQHSRGAGGKRSRHDQRQIHIISAGFDRDSGKVVVGDTVGTGVHIFIEVTDGQRLVPPP